MTFLRPFLCSALLMAASVPGIDAFVSHYLGASKRTVTPHQQTTSLFANPALREALVGKDFQLEEREDQDSELTEVQLNADGTVTLGKTDGPPVKAYEGKWSILETASEADRPFRLRLDRSYETPAPRTGRSTDAGEIVYSVRREFWGNVDKVGDAVEVEGIIHGLDESTQTDCEVGFFALVDSSASS